jgi:hypothetical protein
MLSNLKYGTQLSGGYTFRDNSYGTINGGVGLTFWLSENVGLSLVLHTKKFWR